jgi:hypothetical protein
VGGFQGDYISWGIPKEKENGGKKMLVLFRIQSRLPFGLQ